MSKFPFFKQLDLMDCGPTCLKMIAKFYGKLYSLEYLREKCNITKNGVSLAGISEAAEAIGLRSIVAKVNFDVLRTEAPLPMIVHWRQRHFVIVFNTEDPNFVHVADPAFGLVKYKNEDFIKAWTNNTNVLNTNAEGFVMLFDPSPDFYSADDPVKTKKIGFGILKPYFNRFHKLIWQLFIGLFLASVIQLIFPFLAQAVVDYGINFQDVNFIYLILFAQLTLFVSQTFVQVIRSWLLLHITSRININLISDFLIKLMKLPISFFDSKNMGDLLQRINDQTRIQTFLSTTSLNVLFSIFNVLIFGGVLAYYNTRIFIVFFSGAVLYAVWVLLFIKKRAFLDYQRFDQISGSQNKLYQLVYGMQEIKLNNSERRRRWEWEENQVKLFQISVRNLSISQTQSSGAYFLDQIKDIVITFLAAKAVIDGQITIGVMLSIQYIIGQLNLPIHNFISFVQTAQDAKISLERLAEVSDHKEEEGKEDMLMQSLPINKTIKIHNLSYRYGTTETELALNNVSMEIPEGKVTAIVGTSGSGKSTLIKILLKFYEPLQGFIAVGDMNLRKVSHSFWRQNCGAVMQDGFIFSDSILRNITESAPDGFINKEKLEEAVRISNLEFFIQKLPNGYNTKIGSEGLSISGGERLRILIARAIYKNPEYIFFDEATSSLDSNNEKEIMEKLAMFFKDKTVITVAHRLSTVKNAAQIIVLDKGKVVETGTHLELINNKGAYYTLVKNQLDLT